MIEKELKQLINMSTYDILINRFKWDKKINQTNYYYMDSKKILLKDKITVRIRKIGTELKLQIKVPINITKGFHIKQEFEKQVYEVPKVINDTFISNCIHNEISEVYLLGKLKTERFIVNSGKNLICLDKSFFWGKIDYEIEIEIEEKLSEPLKEILGSLNINFNNKTEGKKSRFLRTLGSKTL